MGLSNGFAAFTGGSDGVGLAMALLLFIGLSKAAAQTDGALRELWRIDNLAGMEEIARTGDARAQAWMGLMLQNRGQCADALKWWTAAAEQGNLWAMSSAASMHGRGLGTPKDRAAAVQWHRRAAELGSASGQSNFASALLHGDGVEKDEQAAARWFSAAVAQGEPFAYSALAKLYAIGTGVARNPVEAYALAVIAESYADSPSPAQQQEAAELKAGLAAEMTPEQMRAALERVEELRSARVKRTE